MEDIIDFKKWGIILLVLIGVGWYVKANYDLQDALKYSRQHPNPDKSAKIDYYVGTVYFMKSDYEDAAGAYTQLLTDYPTSQYAPKALMRLGKIKKTQRKYDEAREAFTLYIKYFPEAPDFKKVSQDYDVIKFERGEDVSQGLADIYSGLDLPANESNEF